MADENILDVLWLAGYLEGEGCFDSIETSPRIRVSSTDLDILIKAATIMDSKNVLRVNRPTRNNKIVYFTGLNGKMAIEWMNKIYPYMGQRRKKRIEECMVAWYGRKFKPRKQKIKILPTTMWVNPSNGLQEVAIG